MTVSEPSATHLSCGHSKWDSRRDCVTCLQFAVDSLNERLAKMSTYSGNIGPEEEDGGGWGGLVPSAEEKREERKIKVARAEPSRGAPDAAHTPGPWEAVRDLDGDHAIWGGDVLIAVTDGWPDATSRARDYKTRTMEDDAANARLIAQAPTLLAENEKLRAGHVVLLEALRKAHTHFSQTTNISNDDWDMLNEMGAAIQQAERT